jgi:hypothetical protein
MLDVQISKSPIRTDMPTLRMLYDPHARLPTSSHVPNTLIWLSHRSFSLLSEAPFRSVQKSRAGPQRWKKCRNTRRGRFLICHNNQGCKQHTSFNASENTPPPSMAHSKLDAFIEASRFILDTDPNKTSGTEPQLQLCQNDNSKYS